MTGADDGTNPQDLMQVTPTKWSLAQVWNAAAIKENRPLKPRDYIYASELGYPMYDRYLKMMGVSYTNPPNSRSLRKFLAGNIWEYVVKHILVAVGVYHMEEVKIDNKPYNNGLEVHGRCDWVAGGYIDRDRAMGNLGKLILPDFLQAVGDRLIEQLAGTTIERRILEQKAVSTFAMDKVERTGAAMPSHSLQGFHYKNGGGINASVVYICKDDCRLAEFDVDAGASEPLYQEDILKITNYYKKKKTPPLEPLVIFDEGLGKFSKNLGVEYSPFLSHYGFNTPEEFRESVKFVDGWNRTLDRYYKVETGATTPKGKRIELTPLNLETGKEIEKVTGKKMHDILHLKMMNGMMEEDAAEVEG